MEGGTGTTMDAARLEDRNLSAAIGFRMSGLGAGGAFDSAGRIVGATKRREPDGGPG
jgi:hypothetical protein